MNLLMLKLSKNNITSTLENQINIDAQHGIFNSVRFIRIQFLMQIESGQSFTVAAADQNQAVM